MGGVVLPPTKPVVITFVCVVAAVMDEHWGGEGCSSGWLVVVQVVL